MPPKRIYLDHAASTSLHREVLAAMLPYLTTNVGNPSSTHRYGRKLKDALEQARSDIAELLSVSASELYFVSGGTEGNHLAIQGLCWANQVKHLITSPVEHASVLACVESLRKQNIAVHYVNINEKGLVDTNSLEKLLEKTAPEPTLVTLMQANNELGTLTDMDTVQTLCRKHSAYLHTDRVQALGYPTLASPLDYAHSFVGSAHKFHGPKGIGVFYLKQSTPCQPLLCGGGQERNMRAGTENVAQIVGMARALKLHLHDWNTPQEQQNLRSKKTYATELLRKWRDDLSFLGEHMHPTILHLGIPNADQETLPMRLDIEGIAVSGGSACGSGAAQRSHVLDALHLPKNHAYLRLSFDRSNTHENIRHLVNTLDKILRS